MKKITILCILLLCVVTDTAQKTSYYRVLFLTVIRNRLLV